MDFFEIYDKLNALGAPALALMTGVLYFEVKRGRDTIIELRKQKEEDQKRMIEELTNNAKVMKEMWDQLKKRGNG